MAETAVVPIDLILFCPKCDARHIDRGDFATKPHHTHACQSCGFSWRPGVTPTRGVQFLPGFKDEAPLPPYDREHPEELYAAVSNQMQEEDARRVEAPFRKLAMEWLSENGVFSPARTRALVPLLTRVHDAAVASSIGVERIHPFEDGPGGDPRTGDEPAQEPKPPMPIETFLSGYDAGKQGVDPNEAWDRYQGVVGPPPPKPPEPPPRTMRERFGTVLWAWRDINAEMVLKLKQDIEMVLEQSPVEDENMLMKLRWLRDTVGVDIERMFARAQAENDGRKKERDDEQ